MLFGSALLISVLHAASLSLATHPGLIGEISNIISHFNLSSINEHIPVTDDNTLHEQILQAQNDKRIYIHNSTDTNFSLVYDEKSFDTDLSNLINLFFQDSTHIVKVINQALKSSSSIQSINGMFELHDITHNDKDVTITSVTFSPIKTDKVWNLYFTTWGYPYVNLHISKKEIILCS